MAETPILILPYKSVTFKMKLIDTGLKILSPTYRREFQLAIPGSMDPYVC